MKEQTYKSLMPDLMEAIFDAAILRRAARR